MSHTLAWLEYRRPAEGQTARVCSSNYLIKIRGAQETFLVKNCHWYGMQLIDHKHLQQRLWSQHCQLATLKLRTVMQNAWVFFFLYSSPRIESMSHSWDFFLRVPKLTWHSLLWQGMVSICVSFLKIFQSTLRWDRSTVIDIERCRFASNYHSCPQVWGK